LNTVTKCKVAVLLSLPLAAVLGLLPLAQGWAVGAVVVAFIIAAILVALTATVMAVAVKTYSLVTATAIFITSLSATISSMVATLHGVTIITLVLLVLGMFLFAFAAWDEAIVSSLTLTVMAISFTAVGLVVGGPSWVGVGAIAVVSAILSAYLLLPEEKAGLSGSH